ncbi:MAG: TonB-dependent receptor [Psychroflexus maritimus]
MLNTSIKIACFFIALIAFIRVNAQEKDSPKKQTADDLLNEWATDSIEDLEEVIISANKMLGSKFEARNRTGSAYYISSEDLKKHNYFNIDRILGEVPGVNLYEEDGFGLRPNISIRGTNPERSRSITLMEDGVLIAPAPYAAPPAYYFPNVARMQSVEILKGSSQIQYGPFTTGGAINFVSTDIPDDFKAELSATYGSFGTANSLARFGDSSEQFGYVVEYLNTRSTGFKKLDGPGRTGFNRDDFMAKFSVNSKAEAKFQQSLQLKFQYAREKSDETYLGLTREDFDKTPFRRYAASQKDFMQTKNRHISLTHNFQFNPETQITTTAYNTDFSRNWFKLDRVSNIDGNDVGISQILDNPSMYPELMSWITGATNSPDDALRNKNNNRVYYSRGIQTKFDHHFYTGDIFHDIEVGFRYHRDEADRFQWYENFRMLDGRMSLTSAEAKGSESNRVDAAEAISAHMLYKIKFNNLSITPGLRYENVVMSRKNWGTVDLERTGFDLSERENNLSELIPGIGANYKLNNQFSFFGGAHKGFAPPSSQNGQDPEESINLELGSRFDFWGIQGELVGFFNDYSTMLGSNAAAGGGPFGDDLDVFNAGAALIKGIEFQVSYNLLEKNEKVSLPIHFSYTYTDARFNSDFEAPRSIWGNVESGDFMPYIAEHQWNTSIGLDYGKFSANINARYRGELRSMPGQGVIPTEESIESMFLIDATANYQVTPKLSLMVNAINLLDNEYPVARVPAGLRPGHPFGIYGGFRLVL